MYVRLRDVVSVCVTVRSHCAFRAERVASFPARSNLSTGDPAPSRCALCLFEYRLEVAGGGPSLWHVVLCVLECFAL